jgi:hypothetical protein
VGVYPREVRDMTEHETQTPMDVAMCVSLNMLANIIQTALTAQWPDSGFVLVVMRPNDEGDDNTKLNYISNVDRDGGAQALRTVIEEWELISSKETRQ